MGQLIQFSTSSAKIKIKKLVYTSNRQKEFVQEAVARLEGLCMEQGTSTISVETMQSVVDEFYKHNNVVQKSTRKD